MRVAHSKGYLITPEGRVYNPSGKEMTLSGRSNQTSTYLYFKVCIGMRTDGRGKKRSHMYPVAVHRYQAFKKYGDIIFMKGVHSRHLDGNSLNNTWGNIAVGTASENQMDIAKDVRKKRAKYAASFLRALTDDQVRDVRARYQAGVRIVDLAREHGVKKSTMHGIVHRNQYKDVL